MIKIPNEVIFNAGENKQINIQGYDWRNSILNWSCNGWLGNIYHVEFHLCRFKISWHNYGKL